jgi:hypothetical protein
MNPRQKAHISEEVAFKAPRNTGSQSGKKTKGERKMSALFYLSARGTHATVLGGQKRSAEGAAASFRVHDVKTRAGPTRRSLRSDTGAVRALK